MAVATVGWFCFVAVILTRIEMRRRFLRWSHWIDRALGMVFIGFAVSLALASLGETPITAPESSLSAG